MRILFAIEPLHFHNRPFHYWYYLHLAAGTGRALRAHGWDVRWSMNAALGVRAVAPDLGPREPSPQRGHALPREHLVLFAQEEVRAHYPGADHITILDGLQHRRWPEATVAAHGRGLRDRLAGFAPDVIITWTPSDPWRAAFPDALILHTENGLFSRAPYPDLQFLDAEGILDRSLLATAADALRALPVAPASAAVLGHFRARARAHHAAHTVFAGFEAELRERHRTLALLPLQFGGEAGFDLSGPFRNQGEYLWHVLERLPEGVGLIVTEHPTARWLGDAIDDETRTYLEAASPQFHWVPPDVVPHAGQMLLHHCDAVISVSSSLGLQAGFFGKPLISPGHGHLRAWSVTPEVADLARPMPDDPPADGAWSWLLEHYFVRTERWSGDGAFADRLLRAWHARWAAGARGLALPPCTEPLTALREPLVAPFAVAAPPRIPEDLVVNPRFDAGADGSAPGWELVPGRGAAVRMVAGPLPGSPDIPAARLLRSALGDGPTLLLQRLPGIERLMGQRARLRFRARGPLGSAVAAYFYLQPGAGGSAPGGTAPQSFALEPQWCECDAHFTLPGPDGVVAGPDAHIELVFLFPPDVGGECALTDVRLGPPWFLPRPRPGG